jgi:NADH dehydrogenase
MKRHLRASGIFKKELHFFTWDVKIDRPFRYRDLGSMATIGRGRAVVDVHGFRLSGFMAWTARLLIHMLKLVGFHNKAMVCMEWGWCYLTRNRSARLITGFGNRGAMPTHI